MPKIHLFEQLERIINCFIISIFASLIRVFFYKNESFVKTLVTFIGGIIAGTLVGYLTGSSPAVAGYDKIFTAVAAILGKEIVNFMINDGPATLRKVISKKTGTK